MSEVMARRWHDSDSVRAIKAASWWGVVLALGFFLASTYTRISAAESRIEETDRRVTRMEERLEALSQRSLDSSTRIETALKDIRDRLDRLVDSNTRRTP